MRAKTALWMGALIAVAVAPAVAGAHWCDDLWGSAYNLTIRPESDTVDLSSAGSAQLVVYVQNNMGYPLINFKLSATASGYSITPTASATTVAKYLMPGERQKVTLAISRSGGAAQLPVASIEFFVNFGNTGAGQDGRYPTDGAGAAVVKTGAGLLPSGFPQLDSGADQARQLQHAAQADFGDLNEGLDELLQLYCAGRGSWDHNGEAVLSSNCSSASATTCPAAMPSGIGTKYDFMRLWAAGHLAARKSALGAARTGVLRDRLKCGWNDNSLVFKGFAAVMLGYLGDEAGARTFLQGKVTSGTADEKVIAKAALYLAGNAADVSQYKADVTAGLTSSSEYVAGACAAALGIRDRDDAPIKSVLLKNADWSEPDTADDGKGMYAAHLLALVAWDRRGWAAAAGETGSVSFYGETGTSSSGTSSGTSGSGGITGSGGGTSGTSGGSGGGTTSSSGGSGGASVDGGSGGGEAAGCGCATTGSAASLGALGLLALLIARRRR